MVCIPIQLINKIVLVKLVYDNYKYPLMAVFSLSLTKEYLQALILAV